MAGERRGGERWIAIGCLDDIPRRGARRVMAPGGSTAIAVIRTADDAVFALADRCPHRGGPLSEGIVQGRAVACPLHGWVINLGSGRAEAPDEGCVRTFAVRLAGGRIWLAAADLEAVAIMRGNAA
jgi:nitrite reductase (NADH) small subunit